MTVAALMNIRGLRHGSAAVLLLGGFGISIAVRVALGTPDVAHSAPAGIAFAACLYAMTLIFRPQASINRTAVILGITGGAVLCLPAILRRVAGSMSHMPAGNYAVWALVVTGVAVAEEAFLRGALYKEVSAASNGIVAIIVSSIAFTVLHIPLYGITSIPLDFAAGLLLSSLRMTTGSFVAPGIAHSIADLAGWWLR